MLNSTQVMKICGIAGIVVGLMGAAYWGAHAAEPKESADLSWKGMLGHPQVQAWERQSKSNIQQLRPALETGVVMVGRDGYLHINEQAEGALKWRALITQENALRKNLYKYLASEQGNPAWEKNIATTFGQEWVETAKRKGWKVAPQ